jgi:hypothetical protein
MVFPFGLTNLHACLQMAKQTMGFCGQALKFRTDVKAFHLQVCSFVKLLNNYSLRFYLHVVLGLS